MTLRPILEPLHDGGFEPVSTTAYLPIGTAEEACGVLLAGRFYAGMNWKGTAPWLRALFASLRRARKRTGWDSPTRLERAALSSRASSRLQNGPNAPL